MRPFLQRALAGCALLLLPRCVLGQPDPGGPLNLAEQIELARLVDVAAQRLKLNVEYDPAILKGTVTLRLGAGISDAELWDLTNRLLAARGFTTVRLPGQDGVLSVVKVEAAGALTKIRPFPGDQAPTTEPGFSAVVYRMKHRAAKQAEEAVKNLVSKAGGSVTILGDDLLLITDLAPRIVQTLAVIEQIDSPGEPAQVVSVPVANLSGTQLATLVTQVMAKRELVDTARSTATDTRPGARALGGSAPGELLPGPDGRSVLVIAPPSALPFWRDMIAALDQREPVQTQNYVPRYFELKEVKRLIEETIRASDAGGPTAGTGAEVALRVVVNDLSGTLIVTATATQHEQIASLIERLNAVPPEGRRPMRIFKIRNRGVNEVLGVLQSLITSGELEGDLASSDAPVPAAPQDTPSAAPAQGGMGPTTSNPSREGAEAIVERNAASRTASPHSSRSSAGLIRASELPPVVLTSDEGTSSIIAVGEPRLLSQIEQLIRQLDVRQPQVMVQALVVSLSDSQSRDLGIELEGQINLSGDSILRLSSLFGLSTAGAVVGTRSATGTGGTGLLLSPGEFAVVIRALETLNKGRSVSMPQVLVNNNQQASFNSTVEQPYATIINTTDTQARTSFGGSTSAGTVVTAKPQIGQSDHLILDYTVELSAFVGDATTENLPPPKQTNNVASSVTLPDGYTVAVGGLELSTDTQSVDQVPLLSEIPVLGEAFKNRSKTNSRTRFFVFLRAEVMRHERFEDLKYVSETMTRAATIDDGWPDLEPRIIH